MVRKKPSRTSATTAAYQLKITLRDSKPPIWRRLQVDGDVTLKKLHMIIQLAMGWTNSHLHQFRVRGTYYSDSTFELGYSMNEAKFKLRQIAPREGATFVYEYDFGDSWEHTVKVEKIASEEGQGRVRPLCITGKNACPPEDCGGLWGYYDFLEIIGNPEHEDHEYMVEWIGGSFDPRRFDIEDVNTELSYLR